jgi:aryl-alcohol dehydrogenase-like predicted oxidoreductase
MKQVALGSSGLVVSSICLGTMTWGSQNTEAEGHAQMDRALERGVNFWDAAEMYPVNPVKAATVGRTEEIIGSWFAKRGLRDRVVLATKVAGIGHPEIRGGEAMTPAVMRAACERSLARLQTDYIDLYQLHWPNRAIYHFRSIWGFDPRGTTGAEVEDHMLGMLHEAAKLQAEGKVRAFGLSNDTVWGAAKWLELAKANGLPRMASVQNEYSLLCRQFDSDWAEFSVMEDMPLLAFSPLATGLLTGKYRGDATPPGSRRSLSPNLNGRITQRVFPAVEAYLGIAARHGIDPVHLALGFCLSRPFPTIPIFGATSMAQLDLALDAADIRLSDAVLAEIAVAHRDHPMPY